MLVYLIQSIDSTNLSSKTMFKVIKHLRTSKTKGKSCYYCDWVYISNNRMFSQHITQHERFFSRANSLTRVSKDESLIYMILARYSKLVTLTDKTKRQWQRSGSRFYTANFNAEIPILKLDGTAHQYFDINIFAQILIQLSSIQCTWYTYDAPGYISYDIQKTVSLQAVCLSFSQIMCYMC